MATFLEELWNSIFTPGTTPTLLVATNASFAALQSLLLVLLLATHSIHFLVLSLLSAGLWYAINWFARELQVENAKSATQHQQQGRGKSPEAGSDTETEVDNHAVPSQQIGGSQTTSTASHLGLGPPTSSSDDLRRRRSLGESSGYISTDSDWEKVSEGCSKA